MFRAPSRLLSSSKKIAVLLSGCGVYDGSEIHEASSVLMHLQRCRTAYDVTAPNRPQFHVMDHQTGQPLDDASPSLGRSMLVESARIARIPVVDATAAGASKDAALAFAAQYAGLILPGGFGVMKNLSTFAVSETPTVLSEVSNLLAAFHAQKKPIGAACIAPILLAKQFPGCTVTLGSTEGDTQGLAVKLGANLVPGGLALDEANKLVSVPAYMLAGAGPYDVFTDIGLLVDAVLAMTSRS